ncbi:MAG: hypothetical protein AAF389_01840 [Gemmatimonadota bacterium]
MRHFIGTVAAGFLLVAVWTLPPEAKFPEAWTLRTGEEIRLQKLERQLRDAGEILRRVQWAEELVPGIVEPGADMAQIFLPEDHGVADQQLVRLSEMLNQDIAELSGNATMPFALAWIDKESGQYPGMGVGGRPRTEYYAGSRDGSPYCLTLHPVGAEGIVRYVTAYLTDGPRRAPQSNLLGLCSWYVEFGMPGAPIEEWLTQGAGAFGTERGDASAVRTYPVLGPFGWRMSRLPLPIQGCQAGQRDACAEVFLDPRAGNGVQQRYETVFSQSPLTWSAMNANLEKVSEFEGYLLNDLETEFGSEAFARFWTSDRPISNAFEDAFGVDAGVWMVDWMDRTRGVEAPGPVLARATSTGSVLALMLFFFLALNAQRRRSTVG